MIERTFLLGIMSSRESLLSNRGVDSFSKISCRIETKLHHTVASVGVLMGLPSIMDGIALNGDLHRTEALYPARKCNYRIFSWLPPRKRKEKNWRESGVKRLVDC